MQRFDAAPPARELIDAPIDPAVNPWDLPHIVVREGDVRLTSAIVFLRG